MLLEIFVGVGDVIVCYVGCGMDGVVFECISYVVCFEKCNLLGVWDMVQVNVYYNEVDYVMDNYML